MFGKPKPTDVFNSRAAEVDNKVYIPREKLETELRRAVNGSKNILMHGESGCGKSWLYKKVFKDENINYLVIDLSDAAKDGMTIEKAMDQVLNFGKEYSQEGYSETKSAEVSAVVASGELETEKSFIRRETAIERVYKKLGGRKTSVLVLDNLEHISDSPSLLIELNSLLMKIDNTEYAKYNVKILVVGIPIGIKKFYSNIRNLDTISNRLEEISEVKGLESDSQVKMFLEKTMINQLKMVFSGDDFKKYYRYIFNVTGGVPQRLHEYCLYLYYAIEDASGATDYKLHKDADIKYVNKSLHKYFIVITKAMNSYETSLQRRNQVIYSLGKVKGTRFKTSDVESVVRKQFKIGNDVNIQISQSLSELSEGDNPILTKIDEHWTFRDTQYAVVIRLMLEKKAGKVVIRSNI